MDKIILCDLRFQGIIGVYPPERVTPQEIVVNMTLFVDTKPAAASDALSDAVDYAALVDKIEAHIQVAADQLIERLVSDLAQLALQSFPQIQKVIVRVDKPQAIPQAARVGIEIERTAADYT